MSIVSSSWAQSEDEPVTDAITWGFVTMELSTGALVWYTVERDKPLQSWQQASLAAAPVALGIGGGVLARHGGWNGDVGRAVHGALWGGFAGYMLGGVLDGMSHHEAFRQGPWTYTLATAGAVASAWLGATQVDAATETPFWLGMPGGAAAGGLGLGGVVALAMAYGGEERTGVQVMGIVTSVAAIGGLLLGSLLDPSPTPRDAARPQELSPIMITIPL